jgi:hypothetical protein
MNTPVTIASVRAHGVRTLLVYCTENAKAIGPVTTGERFWSIPLKLTRRCPIYSADVDVQRVDGGVLTCVLITVCNKRRGRASATSIRRSLLGFDERMTQKWSQGSLPVPHAAVPILLRA